MKKYSTTNLLQNNAKLFQNSLSEPTSCTCPEKYCPKRIPNIGKYYSRSPLLAKLQANSRSIQHLIYSKRNCFKTLWTFPEPFPEAFFEAFSEAFPEAHPEAFLQSIPRSPFSVLSFPVRVLITAIYYLFTNILLTTHYSEYKAYENKIGMEELFNTNSSSQHVLN